MPVFDKRMENKLEDLEGDVEYLKDQNITLLKHLDQTRQICETQQEEIMILKKRLDSEVLKQRNFEELLEQCEHFDLRFSLLEKKCNDDIINLDKINLDNIKLEKKITLLEREVIGLGEKCNLQEVLTSNHVTIFEAIESHRKKERERVDAMQDLYKLLVAQTGSHTNLFEKKFASLQENSKKVAEVQNKINLLEAQTSSHTTLIEKKTALIREDIKKVVEVQDKINLDLQTEIKDIAKSVGEKALETAFKSCMERLIPQPPVAVTNGNTLSQPAMTVGTFPQASLAVAPLYPGAGGFYTTPGSIPQPSYYFNPLPGPVQQSAVQSIPKPIANVICHPQTSVEGRKTFAYTLPQSSIQTSVRPPEAAPPKAPVQQNPPNQLPGNKGQGPGPNNGNTGDSQSRSISTAIVKYNYQAKQQDELSLVKGSRVMILEKSEDGWWRGQYENKIGWIPHNFIQEETD